MCFGDVEIWVGEIWGGIFVKLIDWGEDDIEDICFVGSDGIVDLVGVVGDGREVGNCILVKLGIVCLDFIW